MPKARVYELAKEFGVDSKTVLGKLKDMGEFVKSASSTVEAPVVRKLRSAFQAKAAGAGKRQGGAAGSAPAASAAHSAPRPAASHMAPHAAGGHPAAVPGLKPGRSATSNSAAAPRMSGAKPAPHRAAGAAHEDRQAVAGGFRDRSARPRPGQRQGQSDALHRSGVKPGQGRRPGRPRPGQTGGLPTAGAAHGRQKPTGTPRPGNNPFSSRQGMHIPMPSDIPRPHPMARPTVNSGRGGRPRPGGAAGRSRGGARPGRLSWGASRAGSTGAGARPGANNRWGASSSPAPGRGRGRGGAAGAFGHQGSRSSKARKSRRDKRQEMQEMKAPTIGGVRIPVGNGQTVRLHQGASLADLADKINVNAASLVTVLFNMGEMATATQSLDADTFQLLGDEIGYHIELVSEKEEDKQLLEQFDIDLDAEKNQSDEDLVPRPPVVTVMGHVDHGKTRLLDTIRKTNVSEHEAGGITQRIGAYMVTTHLNGETRKITFLDTPGHEAFTAMRARGAEITDIAILVVAADDGVMPQTVEAINHAQAANVPIVVAVNKIDVPGANPQKVRSQLTEFGLIPEEYGGDTMFVDISAKQGTNIDKLLEAVLLTADAELDLRANPNMPARGATIEARLDKGRGAVANVLVQQGTLRVGDPIVIGRSYGHVRAMLDERGESVKEAGPSAPVAVLGLTSVPTAGDLFIVTPDERSARQIAEKREAAARAASLAKRRKVVSLEGLQEQFKKSEIDMLNLVIKGDSSGSVEALEDELMKIKVSEEVGIQVIHRGVGAITQNDVNLATVDKAVIIGFNVRPNKNVADLAESEGVEIKFYTVIYKAIEEIQAALEGMLKPVYEEKVTSHSEIRQIFRSSKFGNIAGVMVQDGIVKRGTKARITRNGVVTVNDLEISSLRRFKDDVTEVKAGYEAGINLGDFNDIQEGDIIETYEMEQVERDLAAEKAKMEKNEAEKSTSDSSAAQAK